MNYYNIYEKKVISLIENLSTALDSSDQKAIDALKKDYKKIDFTKVEQSLLDKLDELYNHDNYSQEN